MYTECLVGHTTHALQERTWFDVRLVCRWIADGLHGQAIVVRDLRISRKTIEAKARPTIEARPCQDKVISITTQVTDGESVIATVDDRSLGLIGESAPDC